MRSICKEFIDLFADESINVKYVHLNPDLKKETLFFRALRRAIRVPKLSQEDCFQIAEILLQRLLTQTKPTRTQINQQLKIAALLAVEDYTNNPEITVLDGEDFHEYE